MTDDLLTTKERLNEAHESLQARHGRLRQLAQRVLAWEQGDGGAELDLSELRAFMAEDRLPDKGVQ